MDNIIAACPDMRAAIGLHILRQVVVFTHLRVCRLFKDWLYSLRMVDVAKYFGLQSEALHELLRQQSARVDLF